MTFTDTLRTQNSFLHWGPVAEDDGWRVSLLCNGMYSRAVLKRSPDLFLKGKSSQPAEN